jgi:hypothetical protein
MHSRASLSDSSQLKDFVAPQPFHLSTCKASPVLISSASGKVNRGARGKHRLRRRLKLTRSLTISDTATLSGGDDPTGTITFKLFGPNGNDCSGTPSFTSTSMVVGNGSYQAGAYTVTQPGTYRWVVDYSGDDNNKPAGPTTCGDNTETVTITPASPTLTTKASGPARRRRIATGPRAHRRLRTARVRTGRAAQQTFDTATLSGGIAATGTITFKLYGPDSDCSGTPAFTSTKNVSGDGTYNSGPFTPTAAGTYRWVATYSGDPLNNPAGPTACGDPNETVTISKSHTTIKTLASPATAPGSPITDTATLGGGTDPVGSITFTLYGPNDTTCSGDAISTSTRTVHGNGKYTSDPFTPTANGTYRWIAGYSGDPNNAPAATACGDAGEEVVVAPPPLTHPTLTTTPSGGAPAGSPIHDVAHLSGSATAAGASITFELYGPNDDTCTGDFTIVSTVAVTGDGDYTSQLVSPTVPGTYRWIARYSGDANNAAVDTACAAETVTVSKAQPALSTLARPRVIIGGSVTDIATLSGSDPQGTITFSLYRPNDSTCSGTPAFTADQTVIGDGTYTSPAFAPGQAGTYLWVATYSGDANNNPAATACGDSGETVVVLPRRPALITSSSPPAFLRNGRHRVRAAGLSIYDSARLSGFAPTGSITFDLFGPRDPTCSTPIFTSVIEVNGNGVYNSERFVPTASGTYRWQATYSGDTNNKSAGPTGCGDSAEQVDVTVPADPLLTSSASGAVSLGRAIHDTAHLSGGDNPTGTITFKLYGAGDTGCAGSPVFISTVTVAGNNDYTSASFVPSVAGVYRWVENYSGDATNHPAGPTVCADTAETAVVRPSNITPVAPTFSTNAAAQPAGGSSLYDTAHLAGGVDPGGTVTFTLYGPNVQTCAGPPAFTTTVTVGGNGDYRSAAFAVPLPGTYRWVVTYSGDAMNTPVGPTACGDPAETFAVSSTPHPSPQPGPDVPTPPKPAKPKPKPKPAPTPPPPRVTG